MLLSDLESKVSALSADVSSVQLLATEVLEAVEPNSSNALKLHAVFELCENQLRLIEEIDNGLVELRDKLK